VRGKILTAAEAGMIDWQDVPLADHLAAYLVHLKAKDDSPFHLTVTRKRAAKIMEACHFGRLTVPMAGVKGKGRRGTWKAKPLTLEDLDAATARARGRLAKNPALVARLERLGLQRALIYKTLVLTGLRKGELASLTVAQLVLDADPPFLVLDAADEKNREGSTLPLRADLAADLREWLAAKARALQEAAGDVSTVRLDPESRPGERTRQGRFWGLSGAALSAGDWPTAIAAG